MNKLVDIIFSSNDNILLGIVYEKHNQLEILSHFDAIVLTFGSKAN